MIGWNWWKIAFFVALLAFEVARELLVISHGPHAHPTMNSVIFGNERFASASGTWRRTDGGGDLVPASVKIDCFADQGRCVEASAMILDDSVLAPEMDWFDASFSDGLVTYANNMPDCASYIVRIDTKLEKVTALRERKDNPKNPNCSKLERRIGMELVEGGPREKDPLEGHFVPVFQLLAAIFSND